MANIRVQLDLTIPSFPARLLIIVALMFLVAPELDSERVTLSTYYPAPSGVYTRMITTADTFLARDGGNVGIGTAAPAAKLHVLGTANIVGDTSVTGSVRVAGGAGGGRGYVYINNTGTGCVDADVVEGPVCAGAYATFTQGLYVEGWSYQNRGGKVFAQKTPGPVSYEVMARNPLTDAIELMTLNKNDSVAHIYCCPKL